MLWAELAHDLSLPVVLGENSQGTRRTKSTRPVVELIPLDHIETIELQICVRFLC